MTTSPVVSVIDELVEQLSALTYRDEGGAVLIHADQMRALLAERAELLRDAKRYRWLRESMWYVGPDTCEPNEGGGMDGYCNENFFSENLDEAIDAAMQSEAKP